MSFAHCNKWEKSKFPLQHCFSARGIFPPGDLTTSGDIFDCHDRQGWLGEESVLLLASTGVETGNAAKHPTTHKRTLPPSPNYEAQSINSKQAKKTLL